MKKIKISDEQDARLQLVAELGRVADGSFSVSVGGSAMREPLVCKLSAESWYQAVEDVRHILYVMRGCLQKTLGYKVELPVELEHIREQIPEMVVFLKKHEADSS